MINVYWSSCKVTAAFVRFDFFGNIFEKSSNFMKNPSSGSREDGEMNGRRTDGQTDMTKLMVTFRNFANAPKNVSALKGSN